MVIGEALQSGIFDIRQAPVAVTDLVPLVMTAGGGGQCRRHAVDAEYGVAHPPTPILIAEDLDPVYEPVDLLVVRQPPQRRFSKIELAGHVSFAYVRQPGTCSCLRSVCQDVAARVTTPDKNDALPVLRQPKPSGI
jgi:hypothetical protein